jgi:hypothetical protein
MVFVFENKVQGDAHIGIPFEVSNEVNQGMLFKEKRARLFSVGFQEEQKSKQP